MGPAYFIRTSSKTQFGPGICTFDFLQLLLLLCPLSIFFLPSFLPLPPLLVLFFRPLYFDILSLFVLLVLLPILSLHFTLLPFFSSSPSSPSSISLSVTSSSPPFLSPFLFIYFSQHYYQYFFLLGNVTARRRTRASAETSSARGKERTETTGGKNCRRCERS